MPQIDLHVEVYEAGHFISEDKISKDLQRIESMATKSGHRIVVIDCSKSLTDIHGQIEEIVLYVKHEIQHKRNMGEFQDWDPAYENKAEFYKTRGVLNVKDGPALETINQICSLFDVTVPMRGFLRSGAVKHKTLENVWIWWPAAQNRNWENINVNDFEYIIERSKDEMKNEKHVHASLSNVHKRITFFKDQDPLGYILYRFVGVFEIDPLVTTTKGGVMWKKISDILPLETAYTVDKFADFER
jgi:hypothetical protein